MGAVFSLNGYGKAIDFQGLHSILRGPNVHFRRDMEVFFLNEVVVLGNYCLFLA